jgi:intracellular septation protein A
MTSRIVGFARYAVLEFGPLIAFLILASSAGTKAAIAASVATTIALILYKKARGLRSDRIFWLVAALTIGFGTADLIAPTPFLLKWEA